MTDFGLVKRLALEDTEVFGVISLAKSAKQNKARPKEDDASLPKQEESKKQEEPPPPKKKGGAVSTEASGSTVPEATIPVAEETTTKEGDFKCDPWTVEGEGMRGGGEGDM